MSLTPEQIDILVDELRPLIHQHMCMLTAAGKHFEQALRIASITVIQAYTGDYLRDALVSAQQTVDRPKQQ